MIEGEKWQKYDFLDAWSDPEKCWIVSEQHMEKLAKFIMVLVTIKGINNDISNESKHKGY